MVFNFIAAVIIYQDFARSDLSSLVNESAYILVLVEMCILAIALACAMDALRAGRAGSVGGKYPQAFFLLYVLLVGFATYNFAYTIVVLGYYSNHLHIDQRLVDLSTATMFVNPIYLSGMITYSCVVYHDAWVDKLYNNAVTQQQQCGDIV